MIKRDVRRAVRISLREREIARGGEKKKKELGGKNEKKKKIYIFVCCHIHIALKQQS